MQTRTHEQLLDNTLEVYDSQGQDGVFDWVTRVAPELEWALCPPCDTLSPFSRDTCLVCWSVI